MLECGTPSVASRLLIGRRGTWRSGGSSWRGKEVVGFLSLQEERAPRLSRVLVFVVEVCVILMRCVIYSHLASVFVLILFKRWSGARCVVQVIIVGVFVMCVLEPEVKMLCKSLC